MIYITKNIHILGAGSYGEALFDLAEHCGYNVVGLYDDDENKIGEKVFGVEIKNTIKNFIKQDLENKNIAVAIGNNKFRSDILNKVRKNGAKTPSLIHDKVTISKNVKIGSAVYIQPNATIWTSVEINDNCLISPGVVIAHHSKLQEGSFVSTNSAVGANITIREKAFIGMGATIVTGLNFIGKNSIVGAGSTVLNDVEDKTVVAGVPAKKLR